MRKFVQINEDGFIYGVNETAGEVTGTNVMEVPFDFDPTNKRWNGETWEDYEPVPTPQQPTEAQIAQAKLDYLMMMQETL